MHQELPSLPVGESDFQNLRQEQQLYVDKTAYLPMLRKAGKFVFCSRPRRFGKSLTVSALDAFHSGRTELFQGLAAREHMESPLFVPRPVIRLDMSGPADSDSKALLEEEIMDLLGKNAKRHGVSVRGSSSAKAFSSLIEDVHEATGQTVVLLIDEYDAPIIKLIEREPLVYDEHLLAVTRKAIRAFYSKIKFAAAHIDFAFITGVTKFSGMGLFSLLNNLTDISLRRKFGSFMGYTQEEVESYFRPFLKIISNELGKGENEVLAEIREYYDGFSFDGTTRLYNPFSLLSFLGDMLDFPETEFTNYWMKSGSNTLVRKFLKDEALTAEQFQGMVVNRQFASDPGEIDKTSPAGFLYQAGYLTLRATSDNQYTLDYPNSEVRSAFSTLFLENIVPSSFWNSISGLGLELRRHLSKGDVPGIVGDMYRLFVGIIYTDHLDATRKPRGGNKGEGVQASAGTEVAVDEDKDKDKDKDKERKQVAALVEKLLEQRGESFYRSVLHAALWTAGAKVTAEKRENLGRLDLEVDCGALTYVIELKIVKNARGGSAAAKAGMAQMLGKGYGLSSLRPIRVSLAIGKAERNIVACRFKGDGEETVVKIRGSEKPASSHGDSRAKRATASPKPRTGPKPK
ncbi:MAG: ATP-binding protein [Deltaproteobacteria bacterium]|jgi:hypothetical protein|nr:ATP-binding protein [Deltaproteobacteria bacterium]